MLHDKEDLMQMCRVRLAAPIAEINPATRKTGKSILLCLNGVL